MWLNLYTSMACLLFLSLSMIVLCACDNNKFICYAIKSHDKSAQKNINKYQRSKPATADCDVFTELLCHWSSFSID